MTTHCLACDRRIYPQRCSVPSKHKHAGRGLCSPCYAQANRDGTLLDFARITRPKADTLAEVEFLTSIGFTETEAARRLGITRDAVYQARRRTQTHAGTQPA